MAISIFLFFFTLVPVSSYYMIAYFKGQFKKSIAQQQTILVNREAEELDHKFTLVHDVLIGIAKNGMSLNLFGNPAAAQLSLDGQHALKLIFDNSIICFNPEGRLIAETVVVPPRVGTDFSYRDYIKQTIALKRPFISAPYASSQPHHHSVVMFTAPVFKKDGTLAGILGGTLDLLKPNFIGDLASASIGEDGYYYLVDITRTFVMHHDKTRIMQNDMPAGVNPLFDKAINGFEGTSETITSRGVPMLTAFKRLKSTNWILAANMPQKEVYAVMERTERVLWLLIAVGGFLMSILAWLVIRKLINPLLILTGQVRNIQNHENVDVVGNDEISELAVAFNGQMEILRVKEQVLLHERELFQTLSDFANDWVFWRSANGEMNYNSSACEAVSGYTPAELTEHPYLADQMIHPDELPLWHDHVHEADDGGHPKPIEFRIITKNGEQCWIDHVCSRILDQTGGFLGTRGSNRDITDRKLREKELHEQDAILKGEILERRQAQKTLAAKQQQLEELNCSLEERITRSVAEMREKDQLMITQSRQAAMGEMIGNIAHQWRQPLNALGLLLVNIKDAYHFNALDAKFLDMVVADGNRLVQKMSVTINDFRDFFHPAKASIVFSASKQITDAIALMEISLKNDNININFQTSQNLNVLGFPNEYSQVLLNLLSNARDAIRASGTTPRLIEITLGAVNGQGSVTVSDTGGGIAVECIDKIFDPYFSTKEMGTGIGLYMSKMIIERNMGGTLKARNVEGGAEFTILTPLADVVE